MSKKIFTRLLLLFIAVGAMLGLSMGQAKADSATYLYRLGALGYAGPDSRFLFIGEWICKNQGDYSDHALAYAVMINTGEGIYMPEGYEIIRVAREELCPSIGLNYVA